jgi:hypothetical protein
MLKHARTNSQTGKRRGENGVHLQNSCRIVVCIGTVQESEAGSCCALLDERRKTGWRPNMRRRETRHGRRKDERERWWRPHVQGCEVLIDTPQRWLYVACAHTV